jgi:hypothetical protein
MAGGSTTIFLNYNDANFYNLMNDIYPANMFLQLHNSLGRFKDPKQSFPQEVQKHLVVDIFVLNLRLMVRGHVFGAFVLRVLERDRIRSVVRRRNVDLLRYEVIACSCSIIISHTYLSISINSLAIELGSAKIFHTCCRVLEYTNIIAVVMTMK